ncbi:MAG: HAD-IA family hydrolase [Oscillospiraceae bacterium]|nr:HAD-IA family hydrolase [Oscillospiraceae bacterium]
MNKELKWLFFDMGGTIIDETAAWDDRILRTCEKHGIPVAEFRRVMAEGASNNDMEYFFALNHFGISQREKWNSAPEIPYPEAKEVLETLKARGYKLGIIANQALDARDRLRKFGLYDLFEVIVISQEQGVSKPQPAIFLDALYKAGAKAHECVMVGDKLTNDIAPAKALGFKTVWIRQEWGGMQTVTSEELRPDFTIDSLSELKGIL